MFRIVIVMLIYHRQNQEIVSSGLQYPTELQVTIFRFVTTYEYNRLVQTLHGL
jgi:hypothetical protein